MFFFSDENIQANYYTFLKKQKVQNMLFDIFLRLPEIN